MGFLGVHDLLGEETLFREGTRPFSAEALELTTACACSKDDLETVATVHPSIAVKLTRTLGEKLSQMADQLADIAMYDVRDRLIRLMARMAREQGEPTHLGLSLDRHITHDDLASLVGASRVMVSNALGGLREAGLVFVDGQRQFVVSQAVLEGAGALTEPASPPVPPCGCFCRH